MARPREFDELRVLDQTVEVFWEYGYDHAGIQEIAARTGVKAGSLYAAFGNKHALFLAAIDRYVETVSREVMARLEAPPSGLPAIRAYFETMVESILGGRRRWGCLITNAAVQQATADTAIAAKVAAHMKRVEAALAAALRVAVERGEVAPELDAERTAAYLTCMIQGLNVLSRTKPERTQLEAIVATALAGLRRDAA